MNKPMKKMFTDQFGDKLLLESFEGSLCFLTTYSGDEDTNPGTAPEGSTPVALEPEDVITLRKLLKKWLLAHGHLEPKPRMTAVVDFDGEDTNLRDPLAVTIQDDEGIIHEVIWTRGRA